MSREKIRKYLQESNMSINRLAHICNFSPPTLARYLREEDAKLSPRIAWKLFKYFKDKIPIEEFEVSHPLGPYLKRKLKNLAFKANTIPNK